MVRERGFLMNSTLLAVKVRGPVSAVCAIHQPMFHAETNFWTAARSRATSRLMFVMSRTNGGFVARPENRQKSQVL